MKYSLCIRGLSKIAFCKFGLGVQNEAVQRLRVMSREHLGRSKHPLPTHKRQLYVWTSPDGQYQNQTDYILCSWRWRSSMSEWVSDSHSVVSDSLRPHGLQHTRHLCPWNSPSKNTGVGCHFLLQKLYTVSKHKTGSWLWLRSWIPYSKIQT